MSINIDPKSSKQFISQKILPYPAAIKKIAEFKKQGRKVGLCHGGFDLLHPGQMKHFESAKKICDILLVSITTDRFVSLRKGSGRPVYPGNIRAYSVACLESVDYVVISDYQTGVDVIRLLKPSYYIKGPDYINKTTPGITAEREAIASVGGEMKYTNDPAFSTTGIIRYIKEELDRKRLLIIIDRDGTLIEKVDWLGKNKNWKDEVRLNKNVVDLLLCAKAKYDATFIVVSNQTGVARKYFDCRTVEKINEYISSLLKKKGIIINNWKYCPEADASYAKMKKEKEEMEFDHKYVKEVTKRKPCPDMVFDALKELKADIKEFDSVVVIGDHEDDKKLAENLKVRFIDVNGKSYEDLVKELSESSKLNI